jgi:hypothetical protein
MNVLQACQNSMHDASLVSINVGTAAGVAAARQEQLGREWSQFSSDFGKHRRPDAALSVCQAIERCWGRFLARRTSVERPRCESSPQFQQGAAPATFPTWVCLGLVVLALGSKHLRSGQLGSEFGVFSASPPTKYAAFNASKRGCKWVHFDLGTELFLLTC